MFKLLPAVVSLMALATAGCNSSKITDERPFTVTPNTPFVFETTPQAQEHEAIVVVTADNLVTVCLLLDTPAADALKEPFTKLQAKATSLTGTKDMSKTPLTVKVPANKRLTVWVGTFEGTLKATGNVKVIN